VNSLNSVTRSTVAGRPELRGGYSGDPATVTGAASHSQGTHQRLIVPGRAGSPQAYSSNRGGVLPTVAEA
jgi:hypothetical protein